MCGSMADIQSPTAEIRRGKKDRKKKEETTGLKYNGLPYSKSGHNKSAGAVLHGHGGLLPHSGRDRTRVPFGETRRKLECGPMPNVMAALPNIGIALCSTHKVWLTPTTRVPCSNAAKTRSPLKLAGYSKLPNRSQPLLG